MQGRTIERPVFNKAQQRERTIAMGELQEHVQTTAGERGKEKRGFGIN